MKSPAIGERQAGAFTRTQARAAGFARDTIRRRLADGRWATLVPDVFVVGNAPVTSWTRAWAAHLATGGVVARRTAGALFGYVNDTTAYEVVSRANLHVRVPGVREYRVRLDPSDVVTRHGLRVTSPVRTIVDLLASEPAPAATTLLFRAVQQRWIDEAELHRQIEGRRGMTGNNQLRTLVAHLGTGAHSVAEAELHRILATMPGLTFRANAPVVVAGSRFVVDVVLPDHLIAIEVDGRRFHSSTDQFTQDRRRGNLLVGAGYVLLRFTWIDIIERPDEVRRAVERAIAVSNDAKTRRTGP